ncbi:uncharacterized protein LOC143251795 [Tachypleus tridentatus]|uniref:uncharacterized protein LOC143251795 n=1 Tax=Tachypleus tridentatus TaxID=6853 RepID=UPI003FCEF00D
MIVYLQYAIKVRKFEEHYLHNELTLSRYQGLVAYCTGMKMRLVNFILLLVITVYTVGSYAENGSDKITRNIHNGYGCYGDIKGNIRALCRSGNKSGFDEKKDFRIYNGNGRDEKNMFRRVPDVGLVFDSDPNLRDRLTRGTRSKRQRTERRLNSRLRMNDSLHLDT